MKIYPQIIGLLLVPTLCFAGDCPAEEEIAPKCWCIDSIYGGALMCKDFLNPTELYAPVEATRKNRMFAMTIQNSTLRFLPHNLFLKTNYEKIQFVDTELMSFSDGEFAFEGLEKYMTEIRARGTNYVSAWDFQQLRKLKKMHLIDIHHIYLEAITEEFPEFPELSTLGLSYAELSHIADNAFAKCPKLKFFGLDNNRLTTIKRNILPNPALHLINLDLSHNELEILPDDFFTNMPSLGSVYLNNNQFKTLDERVFSNVFKSLGTLIMLDNPFHCDCRMEWLPKSMQPHWFEAECSVPPSLAGIRLKHLSQHSLYC